MPQVWHLHFHVHFLVPHLVFWDTHWSESLPRGQPSPGRAVSMLGHKLGIRTAWASAPQRLEQHLTGLCVSLFGCPMPFGHPIDGTQCLCTRPRSTPESYCCYQVPWGCHCFLSLSGTLLPQSDEAKCFPRLQKNYSSTDPALSSCHHLCG